MSPIMPPGSAQEYIERIAYEGVAPIIPIRFPAGRRGSRIRAAFRVSYLETFSFARLPGHLAELAAAPLFAALSLVFAVRLVALDRDVSRIGFLGAMRRVLRTYYGPTRHDAPPECARTGPLIVVSNHPGLGDFPALIDALGREDVKVIVKRRELMEPMHGLLGRCIVVDDRLDRRADAIRQAVAHVAAGGALVVFPAGRIERDPSLGDGPLLEDWYSISDGIARRVVRAGSQLTVLPVLVDRVYHVPAGLRSFVAGSADAAARSGRAALVTMALPTWSGKQIRVRFAAPVVLDRCPPSGCLGELTDAVRAALWKLCESSVAGVD